MLYGKFAETNNEDTVVEVKLDYSGRVLQLLVEFCFTDELSSLIGDSDNNNGGDGKKVAITTTDKNNNNNSNYTPEEKSRLLTNLSGAAHYFDIPKLESDIQSHLKRMMLEQPSLACAILDESSRMLSGENLAEVAVESIRARPKAALLHREEGVNVNNASHGGCSLTFAAVVGGNNDTTNSTTATNCEEWGEKGGVIALNASLLEGVIFDDQSPACEFTKFKCLQKWVEGCKHEVTKADLDEIELPRKQSGSNLKQLSESNESLKSLDKTQSRTTIPPSPGFIGDVHLESKCQNDDMSIEGNQHERRLAIAKHLAQKLDLSLIPASDLSTTITESQLLPVHDLYQAYRLQALNAERTKSKVFVECAGLAEVNGTYIQRGVHEGTPMYNKEGIWRDREETFRIFLCTYSNGNKSWCLSIVPKGKEPGKTTDLDFYECPVSYGKGGGIGSGSYGTSSTESGLCVVPSKGWKLVNYGQPPVPKCSLITGCLEDA